VAWLDAYSKLGNFRAGIQGIFNERSGFQPSAPESSNYRRNVRRGVQGTNPYAQQQAIPDILRLKAQVQFNRTVGRPRLQHRH